MDLNTLYFFFGCFVRLIFCMVCWYYISFVFEAQSNCPISFRLFSLFVLFAMKTYIECECAEWQQFNYIGKANALFVFDLFKRMKYSKS